MSALHSMLSYLLITGILLMLLGIEIHFVRDFRGSCPNVFSRQRLIEYGLVAANYLGSCLSGVAVLIGTFLVNAAGGGLIHLRTDGWWYYPSALIVILAFDLEAYLAHRAYHKIPLLWSIHSLHHSAEELSVISGARHYWLQTVIDTVLFGTLYGIVLFVPENVAVPYIALTFATGTLTHLGVPIPLGRFSLLFNGPSWHRIHHSRLPQHQDRNFANLFPIFDVIFGTAWIPAGNEFPPVGLETRDKPASVFEGLIWPLRHLWRRRRGSGEAVSAMIGINGEETAFSQFALAQRKDAA